MPFKKYFLFASIAGFSFYNLVLLSSLNVLIHTLHILHESNTAQFSAIAAAFLIANSIALLPVGYLLDRCAARTILLIFLSAAVLSVFMMAFSQSFYLLLLARLLQGTASAASFLIALRTALVLFERTPNRAVGIMITLALTGGMVGNSLLSDSIKVFGTQESLLALALFGAGLWLLHFFLSNLYRSCLNHARDQPYFTFRLKPLLKINIYFGLIVGLLNTPVTLMGSLVGNEYLMATHGISLIKASADSSLIFLGVIIGSTFWGFVAKKIKPSLQIGTVGLIVCCCLLYISVNFDGMWQILLFILIGIFSSVQILFYGLAYQQNDLREIGTALAIIGLAANGIDGLINGVFGISYHLQMMPLAYLPVFLTGIFFIALFLMNKFYTFEGTKLTHH